MDVYRDKNIGWSRDQISCSPNEFMEDLFTYQPLFISRYTSKNDILHLIFTYVAIMTIIWLHTYFCDGLKSRFDYHDVTTSIQQAKYLNSHKVQRLKKENYSASENRKKKTIKCS